LHARFVFYPKEGELLTIEEVIRLELAKRWKIAIYGRGHKSE